MNGKLGYDEAKNITEKNRRTFQCDRPNLIFGPHILLS